MKYMYHILYNVYMSVVLKHNKTKWSCKLKVVLMINIENIYRAF